jgi:hypothetical protein
MVFGWRIIGNAATIKVTKVIVPAKETVKYKIGRLKTATVAAIIKEIAISMLKIALHNAFNCIDSANKKVNPNTIV